MQKINQNNLDSGAASAIVFDYGKINEPFRAQSFLTEKRWHQPIRSQVANQVKLTHVQLHYKL